MVLQVNPIQKEPIVTWEALPADFILPDDPVENIQQPAIAAALTDALRSTGRIQPQMLIGSNFGLVATVNRKMPNKNVNALNRNASVLNKNANELNKNASVLIY
ncbi:hypothetical protein NSTCB13_05901 [Nostoc sp. DSM 114160]|jgi:hypothetical protein